MIRLSNVLIAWLSGIAVPLVGLALPAAAQSRAEIYEPTIWIDPDGCEHWVMDDGAEGYMSPHRTRDGRPVCHRSEICGVVHSDTLFASGRSDIGRAARAQLQTFFRDARATGFLIYGHTDDGASDAANIRLSEARATAVAQVARATGVRVVDVRGFGERQPRASNATADGMRQNRRVDIYCLR